MKGGEWIVAGSVEDGERRLVRFGTAFALYLRVILGWGFGLFRGFAAEAAEEAFE